MPPRSCARGTALFLDTEESAAGSEAAVELKRVRVGRTLRLCALHLAADRRGAARRTSMVCGEESGRRPRSDGCAGQKRARGVGVRLAAQAPAERVGLAAVRMLSCAGCALGGLPTLLSRSLISVASLACASGWVASPDGCLCYSRHVS